MTPNDPTQPCISGTSWQLPTLILFYKGLEVCRLPPFKSDGTVIKTTMDEKGVVAYFELDKSVGKEEWRRRRRAGKKGKGKGKGNIEMEKEREMEMEGAKDK